MFEINNYKKEDTVLFLMQKYKGVFERINKDSVYIWGTGYLGKYVYNVISDKEIDFAGFVDNNPNSSAYNPDDIPRDSLIIIASIYYPEIIEQLKRMNIDNYIYYEELAQVDSQYPTYYMAFDGILEDVEKNKDHYISIRDVFEDELSRKIYDNILLFRMSLDYRYTVSAKEMSIQHGIQDFDEVVKSRFNKETILYDVGACDGKSTKDFLDITGETYKGIYVFEPDKKCIDALKNNLCNVKDITFVESAVGEKKEKVRFIEYGQGAGRVTEDGDLEVKTVKLDDYIKQNNAFVKMDVEGYERMVIEGMKNAIKLYHPMLAVSVYHKPKDIIELTELILSFFPKYKVYFRHYTDTYADTICYFVD